MRATANSIAVIAGTVAGLGYISIHSPVYSGESDPFYLEAKIPLGNIAGRIDHIAIDLTRRRLFVAELGNGSLAVVDVDAQKVIRRITNLKEPQGLTYVTESDTLYLASGGDGSVRMLKGADLKEGGRIDLGNDADNVRLDTMHKKVFVGYGQGSLAAIDVEQQSKSADIPLAGHPEGFQLESNGNRIFVNVPDADSIAVVDRTTGKIGSTWSTGHLRNNFPMALDEDRKQVLAVFRSPPTLAAFSTIDGAPIGSAAACADSDDVFVDAKRRRIYVSCGEGFVDVFKVEPTLERIGHITTAPGARTSLFVPELDKLFVAVRASSREPGAIWVFNSSQ